MNYSTQCKGREAGKDWRYYLIVPVSFLLTKRDWGLKTVNADIKTGINRSSIKCKCNGLWELKAVMMENRPKNERKGGGFRIRNWMME